MNCLPNKTETFAKPALGFFKFNVVSFPRPLAACIPPKGGYYWCTFKQGTAHSYLVAVCNSACIAEYCKTYAETYVDLLPKIKIRYVA